MFAESFAPVWPSTDAYTYSEHTLTTPAVIRPDRLKLCGSARGTTPRTERSLIRRPPQGLEPVGKGHAAAGFRAVFAPSGVASIGDATVVDPAVAAAGFVAAFLAVFRFAVFLAAFLAGFFSDFFFPLLPAALLFFFFFAAFLAFLFLAMRASGKSYESDAPSPTIGHGLFNRRGDPRRIEFLCCHAGEQILVEDVGIELDPCIPHDRRCFPVHRSATELIHVTPDAENADVEQVPEKHAALQAILESQPKPVVPRCLAFGHAMHVVTVTANRGPSPN
jgi:hypothetical protein